ncbi:unnamed protein product [Brassica oleracea]
MQCVRMCIFLVLPVLSRELGAQIGPFSPVFFHLCCFSDKVATFTIRYFRVRNWVASSLSQSTWDALSGSKLFLLCAVQYYAGSDVGYYFFH